MATTTTMAAITKTKAKIKTMIRWGLFLQHQPAHVAIVVEVVEKVVEVTKQRPLLQLTASADQQGLLLLLLLLPKQRGAEASAGVVALYPPLLT
jgi:hypothetical protein